MIQLAPEMAEPQLKLLNFVAASQVSYLLFPFFDFSVFIFSGSFHYHFPHCFCVWQTDAEIDSVPSETQLKHEVHDDRPLYEVDVPNHFHFSVAVFATLAL